MYFLIPIFFTDNKSLGAPASCQFCAKIQFLVLQVQYVAQYPDSTSIRTLETKTQFFRRPFQFSVNEV